MAPVAHLQRPPVQAGQRLAGAPTASRGQHHRAATVDQQALQVAVAAFADVSESPVVAARVFARRQPDPTRKLAPATERMDVSDRADQGGRPQQSDAGHGLQQRADRVGGGQLPQFAVELGDAVLQRPDLLLRPLQASGCRAT